MMQNSSIRRWAWVHKWSSLICTVFLLVICITGLPLLFSDEINQWLQPHTYKALPADRPMANLDRVVATGRGLYPKDIVTSIYIDDDEPQIYLWMAQSWDAVKANPRNMHFIRIDARTGEVLEQAPRATTFTSVMLRIHRGLLADLPGELFLGVMGVLFIAAIISGIVLYGPFNRKLDFGTVRMRRSPRLRWLDLHNLLGVVTLAWALVVGATGVMNELTTPLFTIWQRTDVAAMLRPWHGQPTPAVEAMGSVQAAFDTTQRALPGMAVMSVVFPGSPFGSPYHYLIWTRGGTPLTSRLFTPVLVDARSGALTAVVQMPWYLRALEVSRPLHFGDYGGLPLKVLWALLDLVTIVVLGSGLYLWFARQKRWGEQPGESVNAVLSVAE